MFFAIVAHFHHFHLFWGHIPSKHRYGLSGKAGKCLFIRRSIYSALHAGSMLSWTDDINYQLSMMRDFVLRLALWPTGVGPSEVFSTFYVLLLLLANYCAFLLVMFMF